MIFIMKYIIKINLTFLSLLFKRHTKCRTEGMDAEYCGKHFYNSLNLKHYSKPALLNILFKIISLMAPKMFLTRLVSVAVVSKL